MSINLVVAQLTTVKEHIAGIAKAGEHTRALIVMFGETVKFSEYCLNNGMWANKRTIQGQDSDKPAGAQVLLKWSLNTLEVTPTHEKALQYVASVRAFQAMASMISEGKKRVADKKAQEELEKQKQLAQEEEEKRQAEELAGIIHPVLFVETAKKLSPLETAKNVLANILQDKDCDKATLRQAIEFIAELLA